MFTVEHKPKAERPSENEKSSLTKMVGATSTGTRAWQQTLLKWPSESSLQAEGVFKTGRRRSTAKFLFGFQKGSWGSLTGLVVVTERL